MRYMPLAWGVGQMDITAMSHALRLICRMKLSLPSSPVQAFEERRLGAHNDYLWEYNTAGGVGKPHHEPARETQPELQLPGEGLP